MSASTPGPVPSPCMKICRIDERSGLCEGCLRTLEEIAQWGQAAEAHKRAILAQLVERRKNAGAPRAPFDGD
jgi:predicted Fe-S protein YdhL (DUF1289 family)